VVAVVSGPLASWFGKHSKLGWKARAVGLQVALCCYHDGTPAYDPTLEDLAAWTGMSRTVLQQGRHDLKRSDEVTVLAEGGGRGGAPRLQVKVWFCPPEAGCMQCHQLAAEQRKAARRRQENSKVPPAGTNAVGQAAGQALNVPRQSLNVPPQPQNVPAPGTTTYTDTEEHPLQVGASVSGESSDAPAPSRGSGASLARGGQQERQKQRRWRASTERELAGINDALAHLDLPGWERHRLTREKAELEEALEVNLELWRDEPASGS